MRLPESGVKTRVEARTDRSEVAIGRAALSNTEYVYGSRAPRRTAFARLSTIAMGRSPDTWRYRAGKFVRRHRGGVAAAVAFAVLLGGFAYARAGRRDEARVLADRIEARVVQAGGIWSPAHLYAALGDTERALDMVERAELGRIGLAHVRCSLTYQLLQHEPRMRALIRPVGFPTG